jgi:hypothetical protein
MLQSLGILRVFYPELRDVQFSCGLVVVVVLTAVALVSRPAQSFRAKIGHSFRCSGLSLKIIKSKHHRVSWLSGEAVYFSFL